MASQPERVILTYDDLTDIPADRNRYELFEGELQVTAAPNTAHQTVVLNLAAILRSHVRRRRLGRIFIAPYDVIFSDITVVQPDLPFVSRERLEIVRPEHVRGVPDLVVEVLSPSTAHVDRHVKKQIYARHGVPSYWHLDPERLEFVALALEDGVYRQTIATPEHAAISVAPFLDLVIPQAEVWGWEQASDG